NNTAPSINGIRTGSVVGVGSTARLASTVSAMTRMLETVPTPGLLRSGIHASRTAMPTTADAVPIVMPSRWEKPWCSTSQRSSPSPASTIIAMDRPYIARPLASAVPRSTAYRGDATALRMVGEADADRVEVAAKPAPIGVTVVARVTGQRRRGEPGAGATGQT